MATVSSLIYSLDSTRKVNWTATHEKGISREYPFDLENETPDQYVARTYLQFLWLPQSLMPLHLLVPSLLRVTIAPNSSSSSPHPLHSLLEPILLTPRETANKYHTELPRILLDHGGAGEMEETMMWFAVSHEKATGSQQTSEHASSLWVDAQWRHQWLEKMERREVQVQIIIHILKLSLPGPSPQALEQPKRKKSSKKDIPTTSYEARLESFMDKLSMWQLAARLSEDSRLSGAEGRDWMQVFSQDVIDPLFTLQRPDLCTLLHEKLFPHSPFSDASSTRTESRSPSPDGLPFSRAASSNPTTRGDPAKPDKVRTLARSRSRSLSTSLARERELERAGSVGAINGKKRTLNREVSMSRVFKPKPRLKQGEATQANVKRAVEVDIRPVKNKQSEITLVASTPVKKRTLSRTQSVTAFTDLDASPEPVDSLDSGGGRSPLNDPRGDILVRATPTKAPGRR